MIRPKTYSRRQKSQQYSLYRKLSKLTICESNDYWSNEQKYKNQNSSLSHLQEMSPSEFKFVSACVGRIVAVFPKKHRKSYDGMEQSHRQMSFSGTAFFIGKNLLLTAAHNIYQRKFCELASEVYFIPQIQTNSNQQQITPIKAKSFKVFKDYCNPLNECHPRNDIGIILLEQNNYFTEKNVLDIEWSYKRWQHKNRDLTILGFPKNQFQQNCFNLNKQVNVSHRQDEFIHYRHLTKSGHSGGPLIIKNKNGKTNEFKVIGFHKGEKGTGRFGITLNTLQSTQQMIFQLLEEINGEDSFKQYQPSQKLLKSKIQKLEQQLKEKNQIIENSQKHRVQCNKKIRYLQEKIKSWEQISDFLMKKQLFVCNKQTAVKIEKTKFQVDNKIALLQKIQQQAQIQMENFKIKAKELIKQGRTEDSRKCALQIVNIKEHTKSLSAKRRIWEDNIFKLEQIGIDLCTIDSINQAQQHINVNDSLQNLMNQISEEKRLRDENNQRLDKLRLYNKVQQMISSQVCDILRYLAKSQDDDIDDDIDDLMAQLQAEVRKKNNKQK